MSRKIVGGLTMPGAVEPSWMMLPRLAWLATTRLSNRIGRVPVLGAIAHAAAFPTVLMSLAAASAERRLGTYQGQAVLAIRPLHPARSPAETARRALAHLAGVGVAAATHLVLPLTLAVAAVVFPHWYAITMTAAFAVAAGFGSLGVAATAPPRHSWSSSAKNEARLLANRAGWPLVEATMLAASAHHRRAATVLVRQMVRHADEHQVAVFARARTPLVAKAYQRMGFLPIDGNSQVLWRPPRPASTALAPTHGDSDRRRSAELVR